MNIEKKLGALRNNPAVASIVSKIVDDPIRKGRGNRGEVIPPNDALLNKISAYTQSSIADAKSIFQLLPDMELVKQILVASIISPNNLVSTDINYTLADSEFDASLGTPMLGVISSFCENDYKIKTQLPTMLEDILFYRGSYPIAILPESTIDYAINSNQRISVESIREFCDETGNFKPLGLLGPNTEKKAGEENYSLSLEGLIESESVVKTTIDHKIDKSGILTVTDNLAVLKSPMLRQRIITEKVMGKFKAASLGMEGRQTLPVTEELKQLEGVLYKSRNYSYVPATALGVPNKNTRPTTGNPMIMRLPSESVIPVHVPGDEKTHVAYFVLLDVTGNPLSATSRTDYYGDMVNSLAITPEMAQKMMQSSFGNATQAGRFASNSNQVEMTELLTAYTSVVEQDLIMRLRNGIYGDSVELSRPDEVYRIMFARALAKKQTQLLLIPAELMVYMAFDYNEYGVGKSLIEDSKILASLRIMTLFANTMGGLKNSMGRTGLEITLDPDDNEPAQTVETIIHEYGRTRNIAFPIGASNPLDLIDFLQRAAVDVQVSGNPNYPETKVDIVDRQMNRTLVDQTLDQELKKRHIMSTGLAPETVDLGMNVEFATSIVSSNVMLAKRVKIYQDKMGGFLSDLVRKFVLFSEYKMNELRDIVEANRANIPKHLVERYRAMHSNDSDAKQTEVTVTATPNLTTVEITKEELIKQKAEANKDIPADFVIVEFLKVIEVSLPEPDSVRLENQLAAYEIKERALDKGLEAWINSTFLTDATLGQAGTDIAGLTAAVKAHFLRAWQRENNFLPELTDLVTLDGDGKAVLNLLDENNKYFDAIRKSVGSYVGKLKKENAKSDANLDEEQKKLEQKFGPQEEPIGSLDDGNSGDNTGGDAGSDSLDGSGSDPLDDFDSALSDTDAPSETNTNETKTTEETTETSSTTSTSTTDSENLNPDDFEENASGTGDFNLK